MAPRPSFPTLTLVAALALSVACEDKPAPPKEEPSNKDGGLAGKISGIDKNLAQAVLEVAGQQGKGATAGPPPTGVFAKGVADKEMPPGAPPKLDLGNTGGDPKVSFGSSGLRQGKKRDVTITVSIQTGPQSALPTVDVTFTLEGAPAAAGEPAEAVAAVSVTATVTGAKLAAEQPGQLPPGLAGEIAKLRGCKVRLEMQPSGGARTVGFEPAAGVNDDLAQIPKSAADSLALALLPFPVQPVGPGAFWMVSSREPFVGVDTLAYRMIKLDKVEGDRATLSVNTKRYAAGGQIGLAGIPPHEIHEFSGNGSGQISVPTKDPTQLHAEHTDTLLANLTPQGGGKPGQRMGLQLQIRSGVSAK